MAKRAQVKTRVSIIMPEALFKEMSANMEEMGYSARKKYVWVTEALENLLATTDFPNLVQIGDSMSTFKKTFYLTLEDENYAQLNDAVIQVRERFPAMDGVKSRIVRTAIIQRLLRKEEFIRSPNRISSC